MARRRKPAEYEEARRLRRKLGMPYRQIAATLGISVSSAHAWTCDIELSDEQVHRNLFGPRGPRSPEAIAKFVETWSEKNRERRSEYQQEGREAAHRADPLHRAGCMLYWAEGAKSRNTLKFCNSDPYMLAYFRGFLVESLGISPARLTLRLHVYLGNGLSIEEIEDYWLDILDLPRTCLRKHSINPLPSSSSGKKKRKLLYGVATLGLGDTRVVQHIFGAIQEYAGFDAPGWVDGPPRKKPAASSDE